MFCSSQLVQTLSDRSATVTSTVEPDRFSSVQLEQSGGAVAEGVLLGVLDGVDEGVDDGVEEGVLDGVDDGVEDGVDEGVALGV